MQMTDLVQETTSSYIDGLVKDLRWTAEWRREKANQFPDDDRNLQAAVLLDELADRIGSLAGGDLDRRLVFLQAENGIYLSEEQSQLMREVGFHWSGDPKDLIEELISRLRLD
jgi:hypothetical protein